MDVNKYNQETILKFYKEMFRIRTFDNMAAKLFSQGFLAGNIHTCVGQEATAVGTCQALKPGDFITATHRGHGQCLAKGGDPKLMMAELFGKASGYCGGKGGSMHIADIDLGILGANGIVGAGIPLATGSALASKIKGTDEVSVCFFGDGSSNQGTFHESLNMASAWKLPVVFVCENNLYAVSVSFQRVSNVEYIADRAVAYGIPGAIVDGNDVFAVYEAVEQAVERARAGEGPTLIECRTYRQRGHYEGDPMVYRSKEEMTEWKMRCPIALLRSELLRIYPAHDVKLLHIETEVSKEIEDAVDFAKSAPYPEKGDVLTDVYAMDNKRCVCR